MRIVCAQCNNEVPFGTMGRCENCDGILRVDYPDDRIELLAGIQPGPGINRYRTLMPVSASLPSLGEGDTPLIPSRRIGPELGLRKLFYKYEGCNPSGSFKDRVGVLASALAQESGAEGLLTASSGNAAAAVSAYAAAAGLRCVVLLEPESPPTKLRQILATGARVLPVEGLFSPGPQAVGKLIFDVSRALNFYPAFAWAPVNPYMLDGIKSLAYEIASRLPGAPDVVLTPAGGGDLLTAQWRGYLELKRAGVIPKLPRIIGIQSEMAPPLLEAYRTGADKVPLLPNPRSRLSGLNVPFSGEHALLAVRESGGAMVGVQDDAVFDMQRRLATGEGLWIEPVSAVTLTVLPGLLDRGMIGADERIVCVMSGAGFKDPYLSLEQAEAVSAKTAVPHRVEAIVEAVKKQGVNNEYD
jgi:threonine synthase